MSTRQLGADDFLVFRNKAERVYDHVGVSARRAPDAAGAVSHGAVRRGAYYRCTATENVKTLERLLVDNKFEIETAFPFALYKSTGDVLDDVSMYIHSRNVSYNPHKLRDNHDHSPLRRKRNAVRERRDKGGTGFASCSCRMSCGFLRAPPRLLAATLTAARSSPRLHAHGPT
ncbi:hypothetical protein EVAR_4413_1 [Eumeta japonica]|uniref:Uncharacterized protein n=1 Tax=Eumeta variegata TaxID=151549 RepID=A0A4C1SXQ0_EUMVA|nr:hypothetical protein EVAR_4413_1 [Eumeta japonica]